MSGLAIGVPSDPTEDLGRVIVIYAKTPNGWKWIVVEKTDPTKDTFDIKTDLGRLPVVCESTRLFNDPTDAADDFRRLRRVNYDELLRI